MSPGSLGCVRRWRVGFASPMPYDAQFSREGQGDICSGFSNLASAGPSQSGIFLEHAITKGREKGRISESMPEVLGRSVCHTNMWNIPENNFLRREKEGFFSFLFFVLKFRGPESDTCEKKAHGGGTAA